VEVLTVINGSRRCHAAIWKDSQRTLLGCQGYGEITWLPEGAIMEQSGYQIAVNHPEGSVHFTLDPGDMAVAPVPLMEHPIP
jgi:hypothetical protein